MLFIFELMGLWLLASISILVSPEIFKYIHKLHNQIVDEKNHNIEQEILKIKKEIQNCSYMKQQVLKEIETLQYNINKLSIDHNLEKQKIHSISNNNLEDQKKNILIKLLTEKVDHLFDKIYNKLKNNEQITDYLNNQQIPEIKNISLK